MSKTVKRVMTVMMIGLVAMLGAKAEAHWVILKGQCYWHSGECVRKDEDPPIEPPPLNESPPLGETRAIPTSVEILCPDGTIRTFSQLPSPEALELIAQRRIVEADITRVRNLDAKPFAEWGVPVSDALFFKEAFMGALTCPNSIPPIPRDVIVRVMQVKVNLYTDCAQTPCVGQTPHSGWMATCTLPDKFNFNPPYPKNVPFRGALFECSNISICDAHGVNPKCLPSPSP